MSLIKCYGSHHSVGALTSANHKTSATLQIETDALHLSVHASRLWLHAGESQREKETSSFFSVPYKATSHKAHCWFTFTARLLTAPKLKRVNLVWWIELRQLRMMKQPQKTKEQKCNLPKEFYRYIDFLFIEQKY